jgi:hypothetical protein
MTDQQIGVDLRQMSLAEREAKEIELARAYLLAKLELIDGSREDDLLRIMRAQVALLQGAIEKEEARLAAKGEPIQNVMKPGDDGKLATLQERV